MLIAKSKFLQKKLEQVSKLAEMDLSGYEVIYHIMSKSLERKLFGLVIVPGEKSVYKTHPPKDGEYLFDILKIFTEEYPFVIYEIRQDRKQVFGFIKDLCDCTLRKKVRMLLEKHYGKLSSVQRMYM